MHCLTQPPGPHSTLCTMRAQLTKTPDAAVQGAVQPTLLPLNPCVPSVQKMAPAQTPLLDKLGGVKAVRLVVDEFYAKVLADERINGFFKNTSMAKLKQHQVRLCTHSAVGPLFRSGQ